MMAMLRTCSAEGCETKTLGDQCLEHELAGSLTARNVEGELQRTPEPDNVLAAGSTL